ncbi:MAG: esterase/lipase family protein [Panacagrimonas sp.]
MNGSRLLLVSAIVTSAFLHGCGGAQSPSAVLSPDPKLVTDQATLDAALHCTPFEHPDKPPVLLVHGTFVTGTEQYTLFYTPQLVAMGYDVCIVTYPNRGLGDMQISAEYVVSALRRIHSESGRKVAMIGHSQGGLMPRWALKFFPSAREAVEDFVMLASPNHGTNVALGSDLVSGLVDRLGLSGLPIGLLPEVIYQFSPTSSFVEAVNAGDETPGDIDYTSVYTLFDELVRPVRVDATAPLEPGQTNPRVVNILLQDICPGHLSEHFAIGTTDPIAFDLAVDAISHAGPADVERANANARLCSLLPVDLAALLQAPLVKGLLEIVGSTVGNGLPQPRLALAEPPLMDYARGAAGH